jgi:hypothetical protein
LALNCAKFFIFKYIGTHLLAFEPTRASLRKRWAAVFVDVASRTDGDRAARPLFSQGGEYPLRESANSRVGHPEFLCVP